MSFYIYYANDVIILVAKQILKHFLFPLSTSAFVRGRPATVGIKIEESEVQDTVNGMIVNFVKRFTLCHH